jgi:rubrerythrin
MLGGNNMYYNQAFYQPDYRFNSNTVAFQGIKDLQSHIPQPYRPAKLRIDDKISELIEEAAKIEKRLFAYDKRIMEIIESEVDKKRILKISFNQKKHEKMFGEIYQGLTGRKLLIDFKDLDLREENIKAIIDNRIFQGFEAIDFYRKIYFLLAAVEWKQMMYEIIGDEQNDIIKYIYYLNK